ncbi:MAG: hypothetical protein HC830_12125 [Bacteroidetes bacterium]|nr:hypothetical protein [Bacteroidota bacterium]
MEKYEQALKSLFINKTLQDIEFYDSDMRYFSPDMEKTWIVDGGIEFNLDGEFVSYVFSAEQDFFNVFVEKLENLNERFESKNLGARDVPALDALVGKKVTGIEAKWNFYTELDEDFEPTGDKKYMPIELIVTFDDSSFLQLAAIQYNIQENQLINFQFNSERELLISLNKKI